jgi:DNA-binding transcriptional ArsR family regulator
MPAAAVEKATSRKRRGFLDCAAGVERAWTSTGENDLEFGEVTEMTSTVIPRTEDGTSAARTGTAGAASADGGSEAGAVGGTSATRAVCAFLGRMPGATAAELAEAVGLGRSTVSKALAALAADGQARREAGGRDGRRRLPDRWHPAEASDAGTEHAGTGNVDAEDSTADAVAATTAADAAQPAECEAVAGKLRRGELGGLVLEHVTAHPGVEFTAPAVAKALARSSGAVANALRRLASSGQIQQTGTGPRRYRATVDS